MPPTVEAISLIPSFSAQMQVVYGRRRDLVCGELAAPADVDSPTRVTAGTNTATRRSNANRNADWTRRTRTFTAATSSV